MTLQEGLDEYPENLDGEIGGEDMERSKDWQDELPHQVSADADDWGWGDDQYDWHAEELKDLPYSDDEEGEEDEKIGANPYLHDFLDELDERFEYAGFLQEEWEEFRSIRRETQTVLIGYLAEKAYRKWAEKLYGK